MLCGMWDLVPRPGIEVEPNALEAESQPLDCRESPHRPLLLNSFLCISYE